MCVGGGPFLCGCRGLPASDCALYNNWSLQQHSCPCACQPGLALIPYVKKKKKRKNNNTSFMGPLERSNEAGAKLAFHISTRNQKEVIRPHNNWATLALALMKTHKLLGNC